MAAKLTERVAVNIAGLRRAAGLSQEALARKARISVSYVSMLERGQRSPPLERLEALAAVLKVEPAYMLQRLDWPKD